MLSIREGEMGSKNPIMDEVAINTDLNLILKIMLTHEFERKFVFGLFFYRQTL